MGAHISLALSKEEGKNISLFHFRALVNNKSPRSGRHEGGAMMINLRKFPPLVSSFVCSQFFSHFDSLARFSDRTQAAIAEVAAAASLTLPPLFKKFNLIDIPYFLLLSLII